jgi:hypothetical protein
MPRGRKVGNAGRLAAVGSFMVRNVSKTLKAGFVKRQLKNNVIFLLTKTPNVVNSLKDENEAQHDRENESKNLRACPRLERLFCCQKPPRDDRVLSRRRNAWRENRTPS